MDLRSLIIVTGTVSVEGGATNKVRGTEESGGRKVTVTIDRTITKDRRAANVITADFMRRMRNLAILRTPYGVLVDPAKLRDVKRLLQDVMSKISAYNTTPRTCKISNCVLWERLEGNRLNAVVGWIDAERLRGNTEVRVAFPDAQRLAG